MKKNEMILQTLTKNCGLLIDLLINDKKIKDELFA
jgi:hypothetical protein